MRIQHNLRGGRTIVTERRGVRIVVRGGDRGYVQRAYVTRGDALLFTYLLVHGAYRVGVYRGYYYNRRHYYGYYPAYRYHPVFYSWAYRPWARRCTGVGIEGWGWGPWYGYYGGYFAPIPCIHRRRSGLRITLLQPTCKPLTRPGLTLMPERNTIRATQDGARPDRQPPGDSTPEVKQAIAEEVKAQLAEEQ
jgi:hypothetical protein